MLKASKSHRTELLEWLKSDPRHQVEYLKALIEENADMPEAVLEGLRDIAEVIAGARKSKKTTKKKRMTDGLVRGLEEAVAYRRGKKPLKTTAAAKKK